MVTRVRVDAEGASSEEVRMHLDAVFQMLRQDFTNYTYTGGGYIPPPAQRSLPAESEFVEEVYETSIHEGGVIRWKGRRTVRYIHPDS